MKKLYLLLILIIPTIVSAETYYTNYEPYLMEQTSRIDTNDLIKEEEVNYYRRNVQVKVNEEYYDLGTNPISSPYLDANDKKIVSKREWYYLQQGAIKGVLYPVENDYSVNYFEIINLDNIPKFSLYNLNYEKLNYSITNNLISLDEPINITNLLILFDFTQSMNFNIVFDHSHEYNVSFVEKTIRQYELNFVLVDTYTNRLSNLGVYTSAIFPAFDFYVYYSYQYKYYDFALKEVISTNPEGIYESVTTNYNYFIRDIIDFKDYLILNTDNTNLLLYINSASFDLSKLNISSEINYSINGVYPVTYTYGDLIINKYVTIINEIEEKPEIIIEPQIITEERIIYKEVPGVCPKPQIEYRVITKTKYKYLKSKNQCPLINDTISSKIIDDKKTSKSNDFNVAYILPIIPITTTLLLLKKLRQNKE